MRHRVKKNKFKGGKDATVSILRKLIVGFIKEGKIETTLKRVKILKSAIERIVSKAKDENESTKRFLLKKLNNKEILDKLFMKIIPLFKDRVGGFVRIIKIGKRTGDGAEMGRIEWVKK